MKQPLCAGLCLGLGEAGPHSQHELHPLAASSRTQVLVLEAQNVLLFLYSPLLVVFVLQRAVGHHGAPREAAPASWKLLCLP